jgi:hypothetical protein
MATAKPTANMLVDLPSVLIAVESNKSVSAKSLQAEVHAHDKIQVHKRLLYRVKSSIKSEDNHTYSDEFYKLEPWAQQFNELNPTSLARVVWDGDNRFVGLGLINGCALHVAQHSVQRVTFIDCAFMKHPYYNGQFMALAMVDGNLNNLLLGAALVPAESKENYKWFFELISEKAPLLAPLLNSKNYTHFSDRDKGLIPALQECFPTGNKRNCFLHIVKNLQSKKVSQTALVTTTVLCGSYKERILRTVLMLRWKNCSRSILEQQNTCLTLMVDTKCGHCTNLSKLASVYMGIARRT